jgi:putative ABC transport system permease protein
VEIIWQDVRYTLRTLRKNPGFAIVAILTLALGIGANTAIFSVVDAVLLKPLPYADSRRLVRVEEYHSEAAASDLTYATYLDLKRSSRSLTDIAAYRWWTYSLTGGDGPPESVKGAMVSAEYFTALRLQPALGRFPTAAEDNPGNSAVVVLGYGLWKRRYSSDPHVIGRELKINDTPATIVGVMPAGFHEPYDAEVWTPLVAAGRFAENRRSHLLKVIARLQDAEDLASAAAEAAALAQRIDQANPGVDAGLRISVSGMQRRAAAPVRSLLVVLMAAVSCVLLIACANLANLFLGRGVRRSRELAVRSALGAGRARLARQLVTETLLLSACGAVPGILLARWWLPALQHVVLSSVSGFSAVTLDCRVLAFAAAATLFTGVICGLAPALQAARRDIQKSLNESSRGSSGVRLRRLRDVFVVSQLALALVLLVAAGLLIESFSALLRVPLGFEPHGVLTMKLFLSPTRYPEGSSRGGLYIQEVLQRVRAIPGVKSAAVVDSLPLESGASTDFVIAGRPPLKPGDEPEANIHMASSNYFELMGIPLLAGRFFTPQDSANAPRVMLISRAMAREYWPGADPIGSKVTMKDWGPDLTGTVVGVVGDVKLDGLEVATRPAIYWPIQQFVGAFNALVVRSDAPSSSVVPAIRAAVWSVDPEQTIAKISTMEEIASDQFTERRFNLGLIGAFAALSLLLASIGIYGVLAQSVQQRTREIGIRMALGAQSGDVARLVLSQGLGMSLLGIAIGIAGAMAATRLMSSLLFGVKPLDASAFAAAAAVLLAVTLAACWLPARRASRVDPLVALRYE